jgi:hypothetical protein
MDLAAEACGGARAEVPRKTARKSRCRFLGIQIAMLLAITRNIADFAAAAGVGPTKLTVAGVSMAYEKVL